MMIWFKTLVSSYLYKKLHEQYFSNDYNSMGIVYLLMSIPYKKLFNKIANYVRKIA